LLEWGVEMVVFISILVFLLGASFGSFVNMLEYRVAVEYGLRKNKGGYGNPPVQKKRSFCDWCGEKLNWYDNIPLLSWIFLKGRSRCCGKRLPYSYPLVEFLVGVIFVVIFWMNLGNWWQIGLLMLISVFLMFSFIFDLKYMILPDFSTVILIVLAGLLTLGGYGNPPLQNIIAAMGSMGFLGALYLITKGKGMGLGDVKLAVFMGLFLGVKVVVAYYIAFLVGAVLGGGLMLFKGMKRNREIPFGPFLILGTLIAYQWGEEIIFWAGSFM